MAAVLRVCTEQGKTQGFRKVNRGMKGIGRIKAQLERKQMILCVLGFLIITLCVW